MKGLMGQCPQNFWARTAPESKKNFVRRQCYVNKLLFKHYLHLNTGAYYQCAFRFSRGSSCFEEIDAFAKCMEMHASNFV